MKCLYSLLFLLASLFVHAQTTEVKYLSGQGSDDAVEWDFFCTTGRNSGKWNKIKVPSCWEMQGYGTFNYGHDKPKADETGLYKTSFGIPSGWKDKRIFIVFEGAMTDTEVKVNGKQAGDIHQGAFYRFKREITNLVKAGKTNLLEVKVNKMSANNSINEAERQCDFWVFGGIFRPVYLEAVPEHFIEYTAIDARRQGELKADIFLDKALTSVTAEIEVRNRAGQTMGKITSPLSNGKTNKLSVAGKIDSILPWSSEDPQLYTALITIRQKGNALHTLTDRIGFRTIEVKEKDGVYINGVKMRFKGVNRHSHWPATGRTTNKQLSIDDVKLMKEMNMNAVRMSHYPPDRHFLEVCDSLGMYVIDELCAWQYPPYDTPVGSILVREMLTRDINRPSIIFWANGNEGGFNFDLDPLFPLYDIQKRAVLHPWGKSGGINTVHYITYNSGIGNMFNGRDIFMPTEILHGLYDGGHGSGLDDYWNLMRSNPLAAGMFLWDFADQAVVRSDRNGFLDTDKDHGADGIVGPFREKEASFFTIKEIWSPIHLQKKYITPGWDGRFTLENRYAFTNANACTYSYRLAKVNSLSTAGLQTLSGTIEAPDIRPGEQGTLQLKLPAGWEGYDLLYVTVTDRNQQELFTYSFETGTPDRVAKRLLPERSRSSTDCTAAEESGAWVLRASDVEVRFDKQTGLIRSIASNGKAIPLTNGPVLITGQDIACKSVKLNTAGGIPQLETVYTTNNGKNTVYSFTWTLQPSGTLELDYNYRPQDNVKMAGITFDFPETDIQGTNLLANGPYRVYKNRMKGGTLNLWEKKYNNTITGESWDYPEFKGYYSLFYGMKLNGPAPFAVYCGTENVTLHLFTPAIQTLYDPKRNYTLPEYPAGNISFMNEIPAVGTKFGKAENFGPQSQPGRYKGNGPENNVYGKLYFRF